MLKKLKHYILLFIYYGLAQRLPMQPFPGYKIYYWFRYLLVKRIVASCGEGVIVKTRSYFGEGERLVIGDRSQLGCNSRLNGTIKIGSDVIMAPDVVLMATSHKISDVEIPMNLQGEEEERPIEIGDDVWIGTRVIVLPGVTIGSHSIIGAGSVVTKSFPEFSVIAGVPAKVIRMRV